MIVVEFELGLGEQVKEKERACEESDIREKKAECLGQ